MSSYTDHIKQNLLDESSNRWIQICLEQTSNVCALLIYRCLCHFKGREHERFKVLRCEKDDNYTNHTNNIGSPINFTTIWGPNRESPCG
nr:hypothetical protein [Tanacetum cinerariifolium]